MTAVPPERVREELHRLLFDDGVGAAASLAPRMLADPHSLTPEVRWCLLYFLRGVRLLADRSRLREPGSVLALVAQLVEVSRLSTARMDQNWYEIARELPGHWLGRYENRQVRYSLRELRYLNVLLGRIWRVERQRIALMDPPMIPFYLRAGRRRGRPPTAGFQAGVRAPEGPDRP